MHELSFARQQSLGSNAVDKFVDSAMVQNGGRFDWFQPQINIDRVTLVCPDAQPIFADREALLVVLTNRAN